MTVSCGLWGFKSFHKHGSLHCGQAALSVSVSALASLWDLSGLLLHAGTLIL